jgi:hypothetical protein
MNTTIRRASPVIAVAAGLALLAACSGDDTAAGEPEPAAAAVEEAPDDEPAGNVVEVGMVDFAFVDLPESVPAGTRFTVENLTETELHELVAFRLPDDDDRTVEELTELAPGELVEALGEPATVLLQAPGGDQIPAVGDGTLSEPGRYAIMCFIPTGADPQEYLEAAAASEGGPPQVDGGPPHFVQGMFAELVVE